MRTLLLIPVLLMVAGQALAGDAPPPVFAKKPTAAKAGDKVKIEFAVDRETDVAVFIEDAKGITVRHLVAGVLGKNPPPPLKPGLAQTVEWDGKGDWGKPAGAGPFKVHVALGLGAKYDKVVASEPESLNKVFGLGVGPDGTLYAASQIATHTVHNDGLQLVALNRDGTYQRTLIPIPVRDVVGSCLACATTWRNAGSYSAREGCIHVPAMPICMQSRQICTLERSSLMVLPARYRLLTFYTNGHE